MAAASATYWGLIALAYLSIGCGIASAVLTIWALLFGVTATSRRELADALHQAGYTPVRWLVGLVVAWPLVTFNLWRMLRDLGDKR